jgi:nicotinamidase-related amidase
MAIQLKDLVDPKTTAILCMEMQRGIVGDMSPIAQLVDAVKAGNVPAHIADLMAAARAAGAQVVYCNALKRSDRMLARSFKSGEHGVEGTPSAENLPEIAPKPEDFVTGRYHGMSPFTGTSLDAALRAMGIKTVIATGVSLNVGIVGMAIEAVGLGYNVVVARDCVAGLPASHAESMLQNTLPVLGAVVSSADIKAVW